MRIAVDAALATSRTGGIGNYAARIIEAMAARDDLDILALVPDFAAGRVELPSCTDQFRVEVILSDGPVGEGHYRRRARWEQQILPRHLESVNPDVFFGPVFMAPCGWTGPKVVTVHDLAFERSAAYNIPESTAYYACWARRCAERASALIAVSNHTRDDIVELWGISKEVHVTHLAPCVTPPTIDAEESARRVADAFGLSPPFALFVGDMYPRKNISRLIAAAARQKSLCSEFPLALTLNASEELTRLVQKENAVDRVRAIGRCPSDVLPHLYRTATFLVYPSLMEGFGLPPLEAMTCGTPVAATNCGAVPEVLQDNAVYFDPYDVESMVEALDHLCADSALRERLAERGKAHAVQFGWDRTADQTVQAIRQCVSV